MYRYDLNDIFLISVANIVAYSVAPFGKQLVTDSHFLIVVATTLALSAVAFIITEWGIEQLKGKLCGKGLFGKDLNKCGE